MSDHEVVRDAEAFPQGREWECVRCGERYPESYEPCRCGKCDGLLSRVMMVLKFG